MAETEGILNSRPLKTDNISDPTNSSLPLSPSSPVTMKSNIILPSPGDFSRPDLNSRRRWRRVQHVVNEFWCCWRKEFLQSPQERKKWTKTKKNLKVGDIAILQEANTIRNEWQMCRVMKIYCGDKGFVRSVRLTFGSVDQAGMNNIVDRPVSKVVLLLESEEVDETCSNSQQGSHELNAMWFQDTTYLEGEPCINALQWSAFMEKIMRNNCFETFKITLLCFRITTF